MLCACLWCVVVPSSSGGDLETPLLTVKLIGHRTFQTFSVCLFSTRKAHNAACCCYKGPRLSLIRISHLSRPRHRLHRKKTNQNLFMIFSDISSVSLFVFFNFIIKKNFLSEQCNWASLRHTIIWQNMTL